MAAHQAPPPLGFSRQEHWSESPFPSPMHESEKVKWSHSVVSDSVRPHRWQPMRLPRPWGSPGKNTGVGCHCFSCQHPKKQQMICISFSLFFWSASLSAYYYLKDNWQERETERTDSFIFLPCNYPQNSQELVEEKWPLPAFYYQHHKPLEDIPNSTCLKPKASFTNDNSRRPPLLQLPQSKLSSFHYENLGVTLGFFSW